MTQDLDAWNAIAGVELLRRWFGEIPTFRDAGVDEFTLFAGKGASLRIRAFRMTKEIDERGYFVLDKHAYVTFRFSGLTEVEFEDFDVGGVIDQLQIVRVGECFELLFRSHKGISGRLQAERIGVEVDPVLAEAV
jgi:hypothetical protein